MSELINFYEYIKSDATPNPNYDTHKIPLNFRMLVACASGGGKSNYILNLLSQFTGTFTKIIICTKSDEKLYDYLLEKIKKGIEIYYEGKIPEITKMPKGQSAIIIFDDLVTNNIKAVNEQFIRGRKLNYSSVYITQSYFRTDKLIRLNVNFIAFGYGMIKRDIKLALSEYSMGISLDELVELYNKITSQKMNFMLIDLESRTIRKNIIEIVREF